MILKGKRILLGVTGSIAAYKAAHLVRLLKKKEAEVKVVMTASASHFITPLTISTLSQNPVLIDFVKDKTGTWNNHVELGLWADAMLIAPATAATIGKMATATADNLLLACYLSARCPVFFAPAMDLDMFTHPATSRSMVQLQKDGAILIDAEAGELASGLEGKGRMAEPENILTALEFYFSQRDLLKGKKVLITAGPTKEFIDPVRYITNASSGKMGYALAEVARDFGAEVHLLSGPVSLTPPNGNVNTTIIQTAKEMYETAAASFKDVDIAIFTAAVADYAPKTIATQKIKKQGDNMRLELVKTHDIAAELGKLKKKHQFTVGFALETENELQHAKEKLKSKNFDMIVLNSLRDKGAGFGVDTNKVTIVEAENEFEIGLKPKKEIALDIVQKIAERLG